MVEAAIKELDTRAMTPEKRTAYEMTLSANVLAVENENKKIEEAKSEVKTEAVAKALNRGKLTVEEIADDNSVSIDFVFQVQQGSSAHK